MEPDWTHWRSFAAVVEHGSLSGRKAMKATETKAELAEKGVA